jgi:glycosyltransferase involved in cell wall biosynthesis
MISGDRGILQGRKGAFFYTLEEFHRHWERIDVICPRAAPQPSPRLRLAGSGELPASSLFGNVFFHPSPRSLFFQLPWIFKRGQQLIADYHHSVMTVHEYPPFYNGLGARWLSKVTGVPYALEIHHIVGYPWTASFRECIGRWLSRWFLPWEARSAAAVRCVSRETERVLRSWGIPAGKIQIVPSFYLDRDALLSDLSIPRDYDLVTCGRLVANKGLTALLKAVARLPKVSLLVIGDGPRRFSLEALAHRLGIAHRVTFAGWLPVKEEVYRNLQRAKIFVMNSRSEGGPRVALEAMALGLPVVATRVGVMPEVLEEGVNGVFTTGRASDLAETLRRLLTDAALCERLGSFAHSIFDRFERRRLVADYAHFLQTLVSHPKFQPQPSS